MSQIDELGQVAKMLIVRAEDDWIDGGDFVDLARNSNVQNDNDRRDLCIGLCVRLIAGGILVPGDIDDGFVPWDVGTAEAILRVTEAWLGRTLDEAGLGSLAWFNLTPKGELIAKQLLESGASW